MKVEVVGLLIGRLARIKTRYCVVVLEENREVDENTEWLYVKILHNCHICLAATLEALIFPVGSVVPK